MDKDPPNKPLDVPPLLVRTALKIEALAGSDQDLPPGQRRNRSLLTIVRDLLVDDEVTLKDGTVGSVLAPGRGEDWIQVGWTENGVTCRGSFLVSADPNWNQIMSVKRGGIVLPLLGESTK